MEKKQSSIEWLEEQLHNGRELSKIIQQAKAMHKEEHEETWAAAWNESAKSGHFEQYYNETFGGEKQC